MEGKEGEKKAQKVAVGVIFDDVRSSVLVGKRADNKPFAGKWEFVGGKVEAGESVEEAVSREAFEETGFIVSPIGILGEGRFESDSEIFNVTFCECQIKIGDMVRLEVDSEHSEFDWVSMEDLERLDWVGANGEFAKWLVDFNKIRGPISGDVRQQGET